MTMTLREQLGVIKVLSVSRPSHRLKHASVSQWLQIFHPYKLLGLFAPDWQCPVLLSFNGDILLHKNQEWKSAESQMLPEFQWFVVSSGKIKILAIFTTLRPWQVGIPSKHGGFFVGEIFHNHGFSITGTNKKRRVCRSMDWFKGKSTGNHRFSH